MSVSDYVKLRALIQKLLQNKQRELMAAQIVQEKMRQDYPPKMEDEIWADTKASCLEGFVSELESVLGAMGDIQREMGI